MNLSDLAQEPQLTQVTIPVTKEMVDEINVTREKRGQPLLVYVDGEDYEFYIQDRQPLDIVLALGNSLGQDQKKSIEILRNLILNKEGEKILTGNKQFPIPVMVAAMAKVVEMVGK